VGKHRLVLNAAPISAALPKVRGGRLPYEKELLDDLRKRYAGQIHFRRVDDGKRILAVGLVSGISVPGDEVEIDLTEHPSLVAGLAHEAIFRHLTATAGYPVLSLRPLTVLASKTPNLLGAVVPDWLEKRLVIVIKTRINRLGARDPEPALVCDLRVRTSIGADCAQLMAEGIPLVGRHVAVRRPPTDPRDPDGLAYAGRVAAVEDRHLLLEDHREGLERVAAAEAWLEPRRENLEMCVRQLAGNRAEAILEEAAEQETYLRRGDKRAELLRRTISYFGSRNLELAPGVGMSLGEMASQGGGWFPKVEVLRKPHLVFDPSGARTTSWAQDGLDRHGPYDQRDFSPKTLAIAVVCQARHRGETSAFVERLIQGMPGVGSRMKDGALLEPHGKGFIRRFALQKPRVHFFEAADESADAYVRACHEALDMAIERRFAWDLALIQISDHFRELPNAANPYLVTKAIFLKQRVQVQEVALRTIRLDDFPLACSLANISLATYAKLGGIPWLLRAPLSTDHELVIGIGSHVEKSGRLGSGERTVGITTVFTNDGRYLLDDMTGAVPFEEYVEALKQTLVRTITAVRDQDGWRTTDSVRLVFHAFKPFKGREAEAIEGAVASLGFERVTFAFVHVIDDHPYMMFDEENPGIRSRDGLKGVFAPPRGLIATLDENEVLLCPIGSREVKLASHGTPAPLLLRLDRRSTFRDLRYLARQAFDFSCHSWRSLDASHVPITILYSNLIASLLTGLRDVPGWDPDFMRSPMRRTRWFL